MASYRIVCTNRTYVGPQLEHTHIVGAATAAIQSPPTQAYRWTLQEIFDAMARGEEFWTYGESSRKWAKVYRLQCAHCTAPTIRTGHDAESDNNLENLPACP